MNSLSGKLASFAAGLKYASLPPEVIQKAKHCLMDTVGAALGGSRTAEAKVAKRLAEKLSHKGESTLFTAPRKVGALEAALANGIMSHALELDDGNRYAQGHPGVSVIPSVLALAEKEKSKPKELIPAIVAGYEVFGRVGAGCNPSHFNRGFHTTGTCGTFAAAAACGRLLNLNETKMVSTLGIAGSQAAGLFAFMADGSMTKTLHAGKAAQNGILSAYLAKEGFTGPATVLEDKRGFYQAFADTCNPDRVVSGLGEKYEIMNTYVKFHASCRHSHPAVDAIMDIAARNVLSPGEIDKVNVYTYTIAAKLIDHKDISTPITGKMSLPYSASVAICRGRCGLGDFRPEVMRDSTILELMEKVRVLPDPEIDKMVPDHRGARAEIVLKDGTKLSSEILDAKGEPENPGSANYVYDKFKMLAGIALGRDRAEKIVERIENLEKLKDVSELTKLLAGK
ncbi:MAG TPA: MmgE/PrpD family protein [Thermodesulfobacteriota bacterium]|nr:MmgE/PrpD family protein [Thermodesulfobacteriota bacterium]